MNTNWSGKKLLGIILSATLLGFVLWMAILFWLWLGLRVLGVSADFWGMIGALSTAAAAVTVVVAGILAYIQLSEASKSRYIQVADQLFNELTSPESIAARRWVFQNLPEDPVIGIPALSEEGHEKVKWVLNALDRVAFLTQSGWIPDEMIMAWMNPMVVKAWDKLEPYVDYESKRRGERDYYEEVRELGERCRAWRKDQGLNTEIRWLSDAL